MYIVWAIILLIFRTVRSTTIHAWHKITNMTIISHEIFSYLLTYLSCDVCTVAFLVLMRPTTSSLALLMNFNIPFNISSVSVPYNGDPILAPVKSNSFHFHCTAFSSESFAHGMFQKNEHSIHWLFSRTDLRQFRPMFQFTKTVYETSTLSFYHAQEKPKKPNDMAAMPKIHFLVKYQRVS